MGDELATPPQKAPRDPPLEKKTPAAKPDPAGPSADKWQLKVPVLATPPKALERAQELLKNEGASKSKALAKAPPAAKKRNSADRAQELLQGVAKPPPPSKKRALDQDSLELPEGGGKPPSKRPKVDDNFHFTQARVTTAKKPARTYVRGLCEGRWTLLTEISAFAAGDQHKALVDLIAAKLQDGQGGLTKSQCRDMKFQLLLKLRDPALGL